MSKLQSALGIKPSQVQVPTKSQGKKVDDSKETEHCRKAMKIARTNTSKTLQVKHYVKLKKKDKNEEDKFKYVTSIVEGNVTNHPTNKDLKVVEIIHIYKESIESSDDEIQVLREGYTK